MPRKAKFIQTGKPQSPPKKSPASKSTEKRSAAIVDKRTSGGKIVPETRKDGSKPAQGIQPISERFPALEEQEVELKFFAPEAKVVQMAGTFNGWRPEETPLKQAGSGEWVVRLRLKSGQYEYRFVVDGVWTNDPASPQSAINPYGECNSVLKVGLDDRTDLL